MQSITLSKGMSSMRTKTNMQHLIEIFHLVKIYFLSVMNEDISKYIYLRWFNLIYEAFNTFPKFCLYTYLKIENRIIKLVSVIPS